MPSAAIIGLGPRGISTLERTMSHLRSLSSSQIKPVELHLIDPEDVGGKIWRTDQPKHLCMNTFAHGMTLFSEPGSSVQAPVIPGPTIYEWIRLLLGRQDGVSEAAIASFHTHPPRTNIVEEYGRSYLESLRPESYLPRALYGRYLQWVYNRTLADAPSWVTITRHRSSVERIEALPAHDRLHLKDGNHIDVTAAIAVTGWHTQELTPHEEWLKKQSNSQAQLRWIRAGNPISQGLEQLGAQERTLVRGVGMGLFDVLSLGTEGRGGRFVDDATVPWGKRYLPSGKEPLFSVASRRGYPFLPQTAVDQLPRPAAIPRLKKVIARLGTRQGKASINYDNEVWPAVARDSYQAYLEAFAENTPKSLRNGILPALADIDKATVDPAAGNFGLTELDEAVSRHTGEDFSLATWLRPLPKFESPAAFNEYLVSRVTADLRNSLEGESNPIRAALWSVGYSRKPTQVLGAEGRYTTASRHGMFAAAIDLGQRTCSGPPPFRTQQLLALVQAGIVEFVGANPHLEVRDGLWSMSSTSSGWHRFTATTLLDAWVHKPHVRNSSDLLHASLLHQGRIRPFSDALPPAAREQTGLSSQAETASPELDPDTRRVIDASGNVDERLHMVGIVAHEQYPDTTLSPPIPGTDSWFIQETDKAASSLTKKLFT